MNISTRSFIRIALVFMAFSLMLSCAAKPPPPPPDWSFEKAAITLRLTADSQLNLYNGKPHTLFVCVYQLRDPNAFNQHSDSEDGLYRLLKCELFDASAVKSKDLIIHPGDDLTYNLDRAEGAEYCAVVAGYSRLEKERIIRLMEFPVYTEEKGFLRKSKVQKAGQLNMELTLGPKQIE